MPATEPQSLGRRPFLKSVLAATTVGSISPWQHALAAQPTRSVAMRHLHTKETIEVTYMVDGRFDSEALDRLDYFMRDWRTDDVLPIDRHLFDMLHLVGEQLNAPEPFEVVSAYRTVKTNNMLRKRGRGAVKNSLHTYGMAIDFRLPGTKLSALRKAAMSLKAGGVGYYPKSSFVHMDTGPIRYW